MASGSGRSGKILPTGCFTLLIGGGILALIFGYYAYDIYTSSFSIPEELEAYRTVEQTVALIANKQPASPQSAPLTETDLQLYIGSFDSVYVGWVQITTSLDSLFTSGTERRGELEKINFWDSPQFLGQFTRLPFLARRGLVNYLNNAGVSWEQYRWAKEHVIAAAGITKHDVDSATTTFFGRYFMLEEQESGVAVTPMLEHSTLFPRVTDELGTSEGMDSTQRALAQPYRSMLLTKGLPSLLDIEMLFTN